MLLFVSIMQTDDWMGLELRHLIALKAVADSRGTLIPGPPGQVYDTLAMTEDNEMTLALKSLGAKMVSPMQCRGPAAKGM